MSLTISHSCCVKAWNENMRMTLSLPASPIRFTTSAWRAAVGVHNKIHSQSTCTSKNTRHKHSRAVNHPYVDLVVEWHRLHTCSLYGIGPVVRACRAQYASLIVGYRLERPSTGPRNYQTPHVHRLMETVPTIGVLG